IWRLHQPIFEPANLILKRLEAHTAAHLRLAEHRVELSARASLMNAQAQDSEDRIGHRVLNRSDVVAIAAIVRLRVRFFFSGNRSIPGPSGGVARPPFHLLVLGWWRILRPRLVNVVPDVRSSAVCFMLVGEIFPPWQIVVDEWIHISTAARPTGAVHV